MRFFVRARIFDEVTERNAPHLLTQARELALRLGWEGRPSFWVADGALSRGRPGRSACQKLVAKHPDLAPFLLEQSQLAFAMGGHWHLSNFPSCHFPAANAGAPQLDVHRLQAILDGWRSLDASLTFVLHDVGSVVGAVVGRSPGVYAHGDRVTAREWLASCVSLETVSVQSDGRALVALVATFELEDDVAHRMTSRSDALAWLRDALGHDVKIHEVSAHVRPDESELDASALAHAGPYQSLRATFLAAMAEYDAACRAAPPLELRRERWLKLAARAFTENGLDVLRVTTRQVRAVLPLAAGEFSVTVTWFRDDDDVRLWWSMSSRLREIKAENPVDHVKGFLDPSKGFLTPDDVAARTVELARRVEAVLLDVVGPRPAWVEERWWQPSV